MSNNTTKREWPSKGGSYVRQNGRLVPAETAATTAPARPLHAVRNDPQPKPHTEIKS